MDPTQPILQNFRERKQKLIMRVHFFNETFAADYYVNTFRKIKATTGDR